MRAVLSLGLIASFGLVGSLAAQVPQRPHLIDKPQWVAKPGGADVGRLYPLRAARETVEGSATVSCGVSQDGTLENCQVLFENPQGYGFGEAAIRMASLFRMGARDADGRATVGGVVRLPLIFKMPESDASTRIAVNPAWKTAPSPAALAAAFPEAASRKATGSAVLRCAVEVDGGMKDCKVVSEAPTRMGFGQAAVGLARHFTVDVAAGTPLPFAHVDIPFTFRSADVAQPLTRWIPQWVRTLTPEGAAKYYPAAARTANITGGTGVVNCGASAAGALVDCRVESETPTGFGFGSAALAVTGVMMMNPWTAAGEPVDGRRISLPIRLRLEGASPSQP